MSEYQLDYALIRRYRVFLVRLHDWITRDEDREKAETSSLLFVVRKPETAVPRGASSHPPEIRSLIGRIRVARRWKNADMERQAKSELDRLLAQRHLAEAERLLKRADAGKAAS